VLEITKRRTAEKALAGVLASLGAEEAARLRSTLG
jgi:hypothetical protein